MSATQVIVTCTDCGLERTIAFDHDPAIDASTVWRCCGCFEAWFNARDMKVAIVDAEDFGKLHILPLVEDGHVVRWFR